MTREEQIKQAVESNLDVSFYTPQDGELLKETFYIGAKWADNNPKSPWISVEDDLPCNHKELLISNGITKKVFISTFGCFPPEVDFMLKINGKWIWFMHKSSKFWMPIPELPK